MPSCALSCALCIAVFMLAGGWAMAGDAAGPAAGRAPASVTLDVFSGRPNPTWSLSESAAGELGNRLRDLAPMPGGEAPFDGLGYRSTRVDLRQDGKAVVVVVARGAITVRRDGRAMRYADAGRSLEL